VRSISLLPAADSTTSTSSTGSASSTPTYPVVVRVAAATKALASGSRATVDIDLGAARNVITVPNSAVTPVGSDGTTGTVLRWKSGTVTRATVQIGTVGPLRTQITSGVTVGQQVVLADLSVDLPTNSSTVNRRGGFGGGFNGPPGGGFVAPPGVAVGGR
jgi:HlyD family secretion protein